MAGAGSPGPDEAERVGQVRRRRRLQLAIGLVLLVVLFGLILPQLVDYGEVWATVKSLTASEFAVLVVLGLMRVATQSVMYASVIVGLSFRHAFRSYLASNTVAEFAPPPADLAVRYSLYRAEGISSEAASTGIFLSGLFDWGMKIALPVIALGALVVTGLDDATTRQLFWIGSAATVGLIVIVAFAVRSERFAIGFGRLLGRIISAVLVRFGRNPLEDLGPKSSSLRASVGDTLRARWLPALLATVGTHAMNYVIMLVALRYVGVGPDDVDWVILLVAYALVTLLTAIPITPGGIGVAAVGYTALLAPGDQALANLIASASLLTKVVTWLLPIVLGVVPLLGLRSEDEE